MVRTSYLTDRTSLTLADYVYKQQEQVEQQLYETLNDPDIIIFERFPILYYTAAGEAVP